MGPFGNLDDHVVSGDGSKSLPNPLGLTQSVRDECQCGAARLVVGFAVVNRDHGSRDRRVQGKAEGAEEFWWLGGEERTQAARWSRATNVVHGNEVERVRGGEQVSPVAGNAVCGAALGQPLPVERKLPDDTAFGDESWGIPTHHDTSHNTDQRDRSQLTICASSLPETGLEAPFPQPSG